MSLGNDMGNPRIAWLLKRTAFYWQPLLSEFTQLLPQTKIFTASWPGFARGYDKAFSVEVVGERKLIRWSQAAGGYSPSFTYVSPKIIRSLLQFQPDVIFVDGFGMWTVFVLCLKIVKPWRVVIVCDGSSPGVDHRNSKTRLCLRRIMTRLADAFVTNNRAGKAYFTDVIGAEEQRVFARPYLIPDAKSLSQSSQDQSLPDLRLHHPIFLFVGEIVPRKGLHELFQACSLLKKDGINDYSLLIAGEGWQRQELEDWLETHELKSQVKWLGKVTYQQLGAYFQYADIFLFPTLEDVWGMVVPEAMIFGKAILCSQWSGAAELVKEGENGYIFDPHNPKELAHRMQAFIHDPTLATTMGHQSLEIMTLHSPKIAAQFLANATLEINR